MMLEPSLGENMFVKCNFKQVLEMVIEMKNEKKLKMEIYTLIWVFINFICLQWSSRAGTTGRATQREKKKKMWTMCICNFLFFSIHICDSTNECFIEVNI